MNIALKTQLLMLLHAARSGSEPMVYATMIYENAPDEVLDVLESEAWFTELCRLEPGFAAFKPWAEAVRGIVLQAIAEEQAQPLTGAPAGANVGGDAGKAAPG